MHAARTDADQRQIFDAFVAFDDFVGDAGEGAAAAARGGEWMPDWHRDRFVAPRRPRLSQAA